jgi:tartrate dehydrogenase/decarboxylase/D-malate dehydrogenase
MRRYNIAVMPADGIGPEVITEGVAVLRAVAELHGGLEFETQNYDWCSERYLRLGAMMPPDALKVLEAGGFNSILVGPVGDPRVPDHITLWGMLLPIRQGFDSTSIFVPYACCGTSLVRWLTKVPRTST